MPLCRALWRRELAVPCGAACNDCSHRAVWPFPWLSLTHLVSLRSHNQVTHWQFIHIHCVPYSWESRYPLSRVVFLGPWMVSGTTRHRKVCQPGVIISENRLVAIVCHVCCVLYCTVLCGVWGVGWGWLGLAGQGWPLHQTRPQQSLTLIYFQIMSSDELNQKASLDLKRTTITTPWLANNHELAWVSLYKDVISIRCFPCFTLALTVDFTLPINSNWHLKPRINIGPEIQVKSLTLP